LLVGRGNRAIVRVLNMHFEGRYVFTARSLEDFSRSGQLLSMELTPPLAESFREAFKMNVVMFGAQGAYERMIDRPTTEILADVAELVLRPSAHGEITGVR
jgi:hypothetical protein